MLRPSGECFRGVPRGSGSGWWQDGRKRKRRGVLLWGDLPVCEDKKKPGLDLEKYWEAVPGFLCILQKKEVKKKKPVKTISSHTFKERMSRLPSQDSCNERHIP